MLVDDDSDDRNIFSKALSEVAADYDFNTFKDGKEAIAQFSESENLLLPDILFLDINMPVIDGLEVLHIIRTELKITTLTIAMYSTSSDENDIIKALSGGANVYITKPREFERLKEAIHKVLNATLQKSDANLNIYTFVLSV